MIELSIDKNQVRRLRNALQEDAKRLPGDVAVAINATARKVRTLISKEIRTEIAVTAKGVNRSISIGRRATKNMLGSTVKLAKTKRIPLKEFGARETRKGVSYRISKRTGRKTLPGAFVVHSLGSHAFKRLHKKRLPIAQLFGPSPWGVFLVRRMRPDVVREGNKELRKQIERRIRFRTLKAQGRI